MDPIFVDSAGVAVSTEDIAMKYLRQVAKRIETEGDFVFLPCAEPQITGPTAPVCVGVMQ